MEAGISHHVWTVEGLVSLLRYDDRAISKIDKALFCEALVDAA
jgi:hypothetical protein